MGDLMVCGFCGWSGRVQEICPKCSTRRARNALEKKALRRYAAGELDPVAIAVARELGAPHADAAEEMETGRRPARPA